ncbi:MAG: hypothetical protein SYC29_10985 [Planctomycetota bacterium]|nr:hypothetical protein [Planctomycetota bacterium]
MTPDDLIQSELDARWAWEHLREHSDWLASYLQQPPEALSAEDQRLVALMARLVLGAMWNTHATGDLDRLRPPPDDGAESAAEPARRLTGPLAPPPSSAPET